MQIIVKNYNHLNKALGNWDTPEGKLVKSKDHYDRLVKEGGFISYEESQRQQAKNAPKAYTPSKKAIDVIRYINDKKTRDGKIKIDDGVMKAMQDIGAIKKDIPEYMKVPRGASTGGFYTNNGSKSSSLKENKIKPREVEYATGFSLTPEQRQIIDSCK